MENKFPWGDITRLVNNVIDPKLNGLSVKLHSDMTKRVDELHKEHDDDMANMSSEFDNLNQRFEEVMSLAEQLIQLEHEHHEDVEAINKRIEEIENRLDTEITDALDKVDTKLETIDGILVPVTGVIMFSGSFGGTKNRFPIDGKTKKVMTSWCVCDGVTTNGIVVPDLRDRMIMGAGTTYQIGSTGGAAFHTHTVSGTIGATTLKGDQNAEHEHRSGRYGSGFGYVTPGSGGYQADASASAFFRTTTAGGSQPHDHSFSGIESGSASSLPPYYSLAYIIRIA